MTLSGAIAFKASLAQQIKDVTRSGEIFRDYEGSIRRQTVECPRCGEQYILVEDVNASEQLQEQDYHFLLKSLEGTHPSHASCVVIRDPEGKLQDRCNQLSAALEQRAA